MRFLLINLGQNCFLFISLHTLLRWNKTFLKFYLVFLCLLALQGSAVVSLRQSGIRKDKCIVPQVLKSPHNLFPFYFSVSPYICLFWYDLSFHNLLRENLSRMRLFHLRWNKKSHCIFLSPQRHVKNYIKNQHKRHVFIAYQVDFLMYDSRTKSPKSALRCDFFSCFINL